jgi:TatD DNase family protein
MQFVDSHCHLDGKAFDADREETIARARQAGVHTMLAIGTGEGPPDLEAAIRLADEHPGFHATVGVHPHDAAKYTPECSARLAGLLRHPRVVALGEIGLDYHYNFSPPDEQRMVFREQLEIARDARVPIVIHTREAWPDTLSLLEEHWAPTGLGGIMHCFTSGPEEARRCVELGFHIAFGGVLTYPKAEEVRAAAAVVPAERLLLETDAPYLAPVPKRGKRNEPAYLVETARRLAAVRGVTLEEMAALTTRNFQRLFALNGDRN